MKIVVGHSARIVAGLLAGGLLAFSQIVPATPVNEIRIADINRLILVERDAAAMNALLKKRAQLLTDLMEQNPGAAVHAALSGKARHDLVSRFPDAEALLEQSGEWTGPLMTSVADDLTHGRSWTMRVMHIAGHSVRLYWDSPAAAQCSPSATVQGIRLGNRIAAVSGQVTTDDTSVPGSCSTTGQQNTAVLLINYPSTSLTAGYTASYVGNIFFGPAPSVTDYWNEASYGTTFASGDVFGPFTLDADYTCDQQDEILQAAINAADATVDFTAYQRIFLILPVTVAGGCAYDGMAQVGCSLQQSPSKGSFTASVSWIESITILPNIYGALGGLLQTAIHEGGHNFGLRHASSTDYDTLPAGQIGVAGVHAEYGDPFSSMGTNPGHFAAPHKSSLGWLNDGAGYLDVQSGGSWTLAPLSETTSSVHALRVQRGTGNNQFLWIEYRQPVGRYEPSILDDGSPRNFNGALIHIEDPTQTAWVGYTELLDFEAVRLPNNFSNAILPAGSTWSDPYSNLTITLGTAGPSGLPVTVSYDNGCAALSAGAQSFAPSGGAGQIGVNAPSGCSWTTATDSEWITFTGTHSGTGAGSVSYSVAPNAGVSARSGMISISHQTFTVTQSAQPQGGSVSVTPSSGTGSSQPFSFVFADASSAANLTWGEIIINSAQITSSSCYIHWDAASNSLSLRDDGDDAWLGPVAVGTSGTLANSQCVLSPGSASLTASGASATLNLTVNFTNRFAGDAKNIYMDSQSAATAVGWQQTGTWNVSFPFSPGSVSPNSGSGYSQTFTFTVPGIYTSDEIYVSFSTSSAFGTLEFYDQGCAMEYEATTSSIFLFGNVANAGTGMYGTFGTGQPIHNSQCSVNVAASTAVLTGSTLTLTLPITFTSAFTGQKNIYVFGPGTGMLSGASYSPIGVFTVTAALPSVGLNPPSLVFSPQVVGTPSAAQVVTLTNTGNAVLTITSVAVSGGGASSFGQTNTCGSTLSAGAQCTISVKSTPASVGPLGASLIITGNAAGSPHAVTLSGTGVKAPVAGLSSTALTFGALALGATSPAQTVTLTNTGDAALTISGIVITGGGASSFRQTHTCGSTLSPAAHCTISVKSTPASVGPLSASLVVTDNAAGSPHAVTLSGTGEGTPVVDLSQTTIAFGSLAVGATSPAQTITLTNTGDAPLAISGVAITGGGASSFRQSNTCASSLSPAAHCTISVTFHPTATGSHSASLIITDNAAGNSQAVALKGTGR